jgi:hypothetical protein
LRNGRKIELLIDKAQGNYRNEIQSRNWIIRLNLPVKCKPGNIRVNGKMLGAKSPNKMKLISETEQKEDSMPFTGAGCRPRPMAGPVMELNVDQQNIQEIIRVSFNLK